MNLKITEKALLKSGYVTQIHDSINALTIALPNEDRNPGFGTTSRIEIEKNNLFILILMVNYQLKQVLKV